MGKTDSNGLTSFLEKEGTRIIAGLVVAAIVGAVSYIFFPTKPVPLNQNQTLNGPVSADHGGTVVQGIQAGGNIQINTTPQPVPKGK